MADLLYLSRKDVESVGLCMKDVLAAVDHGFRLKGEQKAEMPPKVGIHPGHDAFIHAMPAYVKEIEVAGLKWVSGFPSNVPRALPYITGLLILNDPMTGIPTAVMDCTWITVMRTGASVGVSAKYLGEHTYRVAGILGCGVQARASLMALAEVLPRLATVRCHDLSRDAAARFVGDMSRMLPQLDVVVCDAPVEITRDADVVVTAIPIVTSPLPPLDANLLKPGGLAVSLDSAWTSDAMAQCGKFCCDDTRQLLYTREQGVYFSGIPVIHADLGELAVGVKPARTSAEERIFSMNMGIAIEDMIVAKLLYDKAVAAQHGTWMPL